VKSFSAEAEAQGHVNGKGRIKRLFIVREHRSVKQKCKIPQGVKSGAGKERRRENRGVWVPGLNIRLAEVDSGGFECGKKTEKGGKRRREGKRS